jgi:hypothetical protein
VIATAIALPVTVILAFALTAHSSQHKGVSGQRAASEAAVTVSAPPSPDVKTQADCVKVFAQLPVQLSGLSPRKTDTDSSFVAAWGNPAIVLRCGVSKPAILNTPSAAQLTDVSGVIWQPDLQKTQAVYTTVDRPVYVEVTVPAEQNQPLSALAGALKALPQVCTALDAGGNSTNSHLPLCH